MMWTLRYGLGAALELELPDELRVSDIAAPAGAEGDEAQAAVSAALGNPCGFPPLTRATVPGDHVAVAIDWDVPEQPAVVAGVLSVLLEGQVQPQDVTLLLSGDPDLPVDPEITHLLPAQVRAAVELQRHDPRQSGGLAYLAASKENRPIYLNRRIFDADLVLPVGCLRPSSALNYLGVHGGLFPGYSDVSTQERFRAPSAVGSPVQQRRHGREAEEASWLLGVQLMLQVVPGRGDSLLHIVAGQAESIAQPGQALCDAAWLHRLPQRAELVIAAVEGGREVQTWENFGHALFAALSAVADNGTVVLCTGLECRPGMALQRLAGSADDPAVLRAIQRDASPDALPASLLVAARQRTRIYLMSGLGQSTVEELGLGYVSCAAEVARLSRERRSCILLSDAHRAMFQSPEAV